MNIFERAVSHWKKENDFAFWHNLSDFQRKSLTKDLIDHFENIYLMGRASILKEIETLIKIESTKVKSKKGGKL